ncbi:hypothetical protein IMG5_041630 [Ichthyophthirius multifiliis]|uniref:Transmembrane protein n=1 Tax=Ichthyophthirius multifiliis TaxID=5932 RepID=G0QM19_ICHMU|nr:hypothetical protein IMG5_041630 [Ichthyophthirius multifiliis]EGR33737.1 hypothetical protein IMG5_041630 [Ichthyophthirius multifiliis]|eukprot:XP_004037723.1 hypothetical protein IMG5_041630 [Ichthyophthirius multifiliis]
MRFLFISIIAMLNLQMKNNQIKLLIIMVLIQQMFLLTTKNNNQINYINQIKKYSGLKFGTNVIIQSQQYKNHLIIKFGCFVQFCSCLVLKKVFRLNLMFQMLEKQLSYQFFWDFFQCFFALITLKKLFIYRKIIFQKQLIIQGLILIFFLNFFILF